MSLLRRELAKVYDEVGRQLFQCAWSVTASSDLAEDAVHDAFARAFRLKERPTDLESYMRRAVRNAALDIVGKRARIVQLTPEELFETSNSDDKDHDLDLELVAAALTSLSRDQRETVLNHLVGGLTFREIAESRDRPLGTIVTWYRRGLEKLRNKVCAADG